MKGIKTQQNVVRTKNIFSLLRTIAVFAITVVVAISSFGVSALTLDTDSYVYGESEKEKIAIPTPYSFKQLIVTSGGSADTFSEPTDIFIKDETMYIADKGNNRIVKMTLTGKFITEYLNSENGAFNGPSGIYVDDSNHIFVADTNGGRIVHLDSKGNYIEQFVKPESELLSNVYTFLPYRVAFSDLTGFMYVVQGKQFMTIDAENNFQGYVGAGDVAFSFANMLFRMFASEKQKKQVSKAEADTYSSFQLSESGLLFATALGKTNQIRIINTIGNNIFPEGSYGEVQYNSSGGRVNPQFLDITEQDEYIITVTEQNTSKLFQYDVEGNLLAVFGGSGNTNGRFTTPIALDADSAGNLYVVDSSQNNIQVLEPTDFIKTVHEALAYYKNGQYEQSLEAWGRVLEADATYPLALQQVGKIKYKQGLYNESMDDFYLANNKTEYGKAYDELRKNFFSDNFEIYAIAVIAVVALLVVLLALAYSAAKRFSYQMFYEKTVKWYSLKLVFMVLFHPIQFCEIVKRNRTKVRVLPLLIFPLLTFAARMFQIYFVNFSLADKRVTDVNILLELGIIFLPFFTFCISNYAFTTIMGGEAKFTELLTAMSYALTPYIVMTPLLTGLSYMFNVSDKGIYVGLSVLTLAWTVALILLAVGNLNQYSGKKFVLVVLLTIVGILIIWAVVLLFFALASQVVMSVNEFVKEFGFVLREQ